VEQRLARTSVGAGAAIIVIAAAAWLVTARAPDTMGMGALPFLGTWMALMTAMMLPSAAPLLLLYRRGSVLVEKVAPGGDRLARLGVVVLIVLALVEGVF
jgi:predicted metal-binding membrane protein